MITWPLMRLNKSILTINAIVRDKKLVKPITISHVKFSDKFQICLSLIN